MAVNKTVLTGSPEEMERQLAGACRDAPPHEVHTGGKLRALALGLASREGVAVTVAVYDRDAMELHVNLESNPSGDPVILSRDRTGNHCEIQWSRWMSITDETSICQLAELIVKMLATDAGGSQAAPGKEGGLCG